VISFPSVCNILINPSRLFHIIAIVFQVREAVCVCVFAGPPSKKRKSARKHLQSETTSRKKSKSGEVGGRTKEKKRRGKGKGVKKGRAKKSSNDVEEK
jgi:hypothetical protein